jgi:malate dehydrogenase
VRSVVILGAGELGGALARHLAAADVCARVTIVDEAYTVAAGKALDIRQAAPIDGYSTAVFGTADESVAIDADAIVMADVATGGAEWQGDAAVGLVQRMARLNERATLICAGARQFDVVERAVREVGVARHRVLGSAPEALRAAVAAMAALEAGCAPADVSLLVLGRPPAEIIVPWEDAAIGGRRAAEVLPPPAMTRLDRRLPRLWPPGPLTLAAAATRFLVVAATRGRHTLSAFVALTREAGEPDQVGMLPVMLGSNGVYRVLAPSLSIRDRVRLDTALHR